MASILFQRPAHNADSGAREVTHTTHLAPCVQIRAQARQLADCRGVTLVRRFEKRGVIVLRAIHAREREYHGASESWRTRRASKLTSSGSWLSICAPAATRRLTSAVLPASAAAHSCAPSSQHSPVGHGGLECAAGAHSALSAAHATCWFSDPAAISAPTADSALDRALAHSALDGSEAVGPDAWPPGRQPGRLVHQRQDRRARGHMDACRSHCAAANVRPVDAHAYGARALAQMVQAARAGWRRLPRPHTAHVMTRHLRIRRDGQARWPGLSTTR
jgi:hypothetical protein